MKLGLGLSIPGVATMGGNQAERILSTAKHLYDARRGSSFTDYGTATVKADGVAAPSAALPAHSGKWWTFDGNDDSVNLFGPSSWTLGPTDERTLLLVFKRDSASNPGAEATVFSCKDTVTGTSRGPRVFINTSGAAVSVIGDGTNSQTKTGTAGVVVNGTIVVFAMRFNSTLIHCTVNGATAGSTTRGLVVDATPTVITNARVGTGANSLLLDFDGSIGLVAVFERFLSNAEEAVARAGLAAAFA